MINFIDQFAIDMFMGSDSKFLDTLALTLTNTWVWTPMFIAILLLIIKNHDNMQFIGLCFFCAIGAVLLSSGIANIIVKPWIERLRPCNTPELKYLVQIAGDLHNKDFSFFSAHAANTMALTVFFALAVRSGLLNVIMGLWTIIMCWTRLYLAQHFLTDILTGLACGMLMGLLMYVVYIKVGLAMGMKRNYISSQYTETGYSFLDIDIVVSAFLLTLIYALIPIHSL